MTVRTIDTSLATNLPLDADAVTGPLNVELYQSFSVQSILTYGGGDDSEGAISMESSNDGVNWDPIPAASFSYDNTITSYGLGYEKQPGFKYIQMRIAEDTGSGGTVTFLYHGVYKA